MSNGDEERGPADILHLEVHPSVVFKLGEDLITDSMQALIELVKNSYDADATWADIVINTGLANSEHPIQPSIVIKDNGSGMTIEQIRRGWLTISNSVKREMKERGLSTRLGRTPLGDKGLGRLGAQRLGDVVTIVTKPSGDDAEHEITIDWRDFLSKSSLNDVDLRLLTRSTQETSGTTLTVTQLREPKQWRDAAKSGPEGSTSALQKELSVLISPYGDERGLKILLRVDEERIDLYDLPSRVRNAAEVRYLLNYANGKLDIVGEASLAYWAPQEKGRAVDRAAFDSLLQADSGDRFLDWLRTRRPKQMQAFNCHAAEGAYFLQAQRSIELGALDDVALHRSKEGDFPADPGPFRGEVDYITLGQGHPEAFNNRSEFRNYLKSLAGIRVYRDGFGVRMDEDWLGLRKAQTSGKSFYGLRPENTLGFIDISARQNAQLVETTDREGFADTPHYRNLMGLLQGWRSFTEQFQTFIRRAYNDYRQEVEVISTGVDPTASSEVLIQHVEDTRTRTIVSAKQRLRTLRNEAEATAKSHERVASELDASQRSLFAGSIDPAIAQELSNLQAGDKRTGQSVTEIEEIVESLESERAVLQILRDQSDQLRAQLAQAWETVSLGLTAEAVSHEVAHVADGVSVRSAQIRRHLTEVEIADRRLSNYIQYVQSAASALKRQIAHLNPSLRYMRERREKISLAEFCGDLADYHRDRWSKGPLSFSVEVPRDFTIEVNRGKLTQILDNLLLNSEYWLLQDHRVGSQESPAVSLLIDEPYLIFSDNGRGIDRSVESTLFEPFVSFKKRGEGRGLGLYVVTQLLDSEGCGIELTPDRNSHGRLYRFQINLGGMRVDA
ncbi:ATP-binding protein [Streptomyces rubrogriseus]|uniref:ATP-binding protein n=1 Tax=Streptomyces rubrogriseus TaxID=194673 RepID=UPI00131EFB06|nr:ATP-binding protein [Streptomyces rubrogriseus]